MKSLLTGACILLIAVLAIALYYNYPSIVHLLPQGAHIWRQSDCMAMTQNYQQFSLDFHQPATYNLQSVDGKVAGEFPVFYYIAAQFKNCALVLRLIHTIVFLAGIIATYFVAFYFLQRSLLAVYCSLLLFTSPLLVFYGNNFLSDVPALSFAFIGWAIFLNKQEKLFWTMVAFAFFAFAGLLKASQVINFAIVFVFIWKAKRIKIANLIPFLLFVIPAIWYFYAKKYNHQYHDHYYFLSVFPIWKLSFYEIGLGAWRMCVSWSNNYFWRPALFLLIIASFFLIRNRKKLNTDLKNIISISLVFTILYIVFFYQKMIAHEYYYTVFFIFFLFLIIGVLKTYNLFHAENVFAHTLLFLFLIPNIIFCKNFVAEELKYSPLNQYLSSDEMQVFLEEHGVTKDKTIISLPDNTTNKTLYQLKRKGYTQFNDYVFLLQHQKADYMLLALDCYINAEKLKPYLKDSIGNFHGMVLYKLK